MSVAFLAGRPWVSQIFPCPVPPHQKVVTWWYKPGHCWGALGPLEKDWQQEKTTPQHSCINMFRAIEFCPDLTASDFHILSLQPTGWNLLKFRLLRTHCVPLRALYVSCGHDLRTWLRSVGPSGKLASFWKIRLCGKRRSSFTELPGNAEAPLVIAEGNV